MDAAKLADPVTRVYEDVTDQIIENIARHFNTGHALPTLEWQFRKLAEVGQLREEVIRIIAERTKQAPELIKIALEKAAFDAIKPLEPQFREAVKAGYLKDGGPPEVSPSVRRVLETYQAQAEEAANMVNTVMLESGLRSYRKIVSGVVMMEQAAMSARQIEAALQILNAETGKVLTGVSSRREALMRAIEQMSEEGLTGFVDRAGHNWQPETYINMDIRTTCGNVATEAVFARNRDHGNDLIWVRSKPGSRPLCYPWQGKILSQTDRSGTVKDLRGNVHEIIPISSTSYGEAAGLFGINCGHVPPNVFIPAGSMVRGEPEPEERNERQYAQSQRQRAIERRIRKAKREKAALEAAGLDASKADAKVRRAQADMREFIKSTGRARRRDREQIGGKKCKNTSARN